MAIRTIANGGGNWNNVATWVEGIVPTAADDVVATATSGSVTVNTVSACLTLNLTNYVGTLTFNSTLTVSGNVTFVAGMALAGTGTLAVNANATLNSGGLTFPGTLLFNATGAQTITLANNWTVAGTLSFASTSTLTINNNQITALDGVNVSASSGITGTFTLVLGGVTTLQGNGIIRCNVNINSPGNTVTLTLAGTPNLNFNGATFTYTTAGSVVFGAGANAKLLCVTNATTLNTNGITWPSIEFQNLTVTLTSDLTTSGTLTINTGNVVVNGVGKTFNIGGSITLNRSISGTASLVMNGTGVWSASAVYAITNNLTFAGDVTVSGTVYYNNGTLKYTSGTITTAGSTMIVGASTTFDTVGMTWNNITFGGAATMTLTTNMTVGGNLVIQTGAVVVNGVSRTLFVGGSFTINQGLSGTATIELTGTGTWSGGAFNVSSNLVFNNGANTFTVSGNVYYITGTLTYTSGTIVTTGSTLNIGGNVTLNTSTLAWNNVSISQWITVTMSSNLTMLGNLTITPGAALPTLNGSSILVGGNFTLNGSPGNLMTLPGTTTIVMNGTGTFTNPVNTARIEVNFTINTTGTFTISGSLAFSSKTLTYVQGNVDTTNGTLFIFGSGSTTTLDTSGMKWTSVFLLQLITINLTSDLNIDTLGVCYLTPANSSTGANFATVTFGGVGKLNITTALNIGNGQWTLATNQDGSSVLNLPNPITVPTLNIRLSAGRSAGFAYAAYNSVINNHSVTVTDRITMLVTSIQLPVTPSLTGTSEIIMKGNSWTIQSNSTTGVIDTIGNNHGCGSNLTLDTPYLRFTSDIISYPNFIYNTSRTFKNLCPRVVTNVPLLLGTGPTMLNMNNIPWKKVTVTSGITVTMNQFFAGTASYKMPIVPSSTTNYNITFTDSFEKTTKFVEISNCTLTRPNQLIVLGDCRAKGTNSGIRYTNQSPNGLPKFLTKTSPSMTFDTGGLVPDPNFVKLI